MVDIISKRGPTDPEPVEPPKSRQFPVRPPDATKEGDYYDRCPNDGCVEVDRTFKIGGVDGHNEEHLFASIYSADMRQGGCGALWSRTTPQGEERFHRDRGLGDPKWRTRSGMRLLSVPSERFQDNYERIDWSKKPAPNKSLFEGGALSR